MDTPLKTIPPNPRKNKGWWADRVRGSLIAQITAAGLLVAGLPGCANDISTRAQKLELDMNKERAVKTLGSRHSTVAARKEGDGGKVEVLLFEDKRGNNILGYFRDGKLVQWGASAILQNTPH